MQQLERKTLTLHEKFKAFFLHLELCVCAFVCMLDLIRVAVDVGEKVYFAHIVSAGNQALKVVLYIIHLGSRWNDGLIHVNIFEWGTEN